MQRVILTILLFTAALPASAFSPIVSEVSQPYEVVPLDGEITVRQPVLGELSGYPVMYEVTSDDPFTFKAQIAQPARGSNEPIPFALIAIRQNDRGGGVTEVARVNPELSDWQKEKNSVLGLTLWQSPVLEAEVEPGTYRVEVSTPVNEGKYLLTIGDGEDEDGYFTTLGGVYTTQQFFDRGFFTLLLSSYVYYPLGILLLVFIMQRTWKYRKLIMNSHDA